MNADQPLLGREMLLRQKFCWISVLHCHSVKIRKRLQSNIFSGRWGNWGPAGRNDLPFNHSTIIEELCMLCITVYRCYEQDRHELAPDVAHRPMVGEGYK